MLLTEIDLASLGGLVLLDIDINKDFTEATRQDVRQAVLLSTASGVIKCNPGLINCFTRTVSKNIFNFGE